MKKQKKTNTEQPDEKPKVHPELKGFEMKINSFGEISSNYTIDEINDFLNKNVEDRKLKGKPEGDEAEG